MEIILNDVDIYNTLEYIVMKSGENGKTLIEEKKILNLQNELNGEWLISKGLEKIANIVHTYSNKNELKLDFISNKHHKLSKINSDTVYGITIDDKIIKIGKSETGFTKRWGSYQNGSMERQKGAGNGSVTNHYVLMALTEAMRNNLKISVYIKNMGREERTVNILGQDKIEPYFPKGNCDSWEKALLQLYKKDNGNYPPLSSYA